MGSYCDKCGDDGYITEVGNFMDGNEQDLCDECHKEWLEDRWGSQITRGKNNE